MSLLLLISYCQVYFSYTICTLWWVRCFVADPQANPKNNICSGFCACAWLIFFLLLNEFKAGVNLPCFFIYKGLGTPCSLLSPQTCPGEGNRMLLHPIVMVGLDLSSCLVPSELLQLLSATRVCPVADYIGSACVSAVSCHPNHLKWLFE